MSDTPQTAPLKRSTIFFYGIAELPLYMMIVPVTVMIPNYYGQDLGISIAVLAVLPLATRLFDAFTDPIIGRLSDRTRSRWGRRRPWILAALPLMMIGIYKLFLPEPPVTVFYLFGWLIVLWTGWTMFLIPYFAWAAELTPDFHERSVVTGFRSMMGVVGQLLALLVPAAALYFFDFGGTGNVLMLIGIMALVMIPTIVLPALTQVPERQDYVPSTIPLGAAAKLMAANGPLKRLMLAFFFNFFGLAITMNLYLFYVRSAIGEEERWVYILATFFGCNMLAVPFWVWLSRKIGKHRSWGASLILISVASPFYLLLGPGDLWYMIPVTVLSGIAAGSFQALPNSMKADVIDIDTLQSGEDRAALFFSVWSFVQKASLALGGSFGLALLSMTGYQAAPGAVNTAEGIWGLKFLFALAPSFFFLAATAVAWKYPITEERQREVRDELARRRSGREPRAIAE